MKKLIALMLGMIVLSALASAEMSMWNTVIIDRNANTVSHHVFYVFDDTSDSHVGRNKDIPITLYYQVQNMPYNLVPDGYGSVDWCNLTINHYINTYDSLGNLVNNSYEFQSAYFDSTNSTSGSIIIDARSSDSITGDFKCHYTDSRDLFLQNTLFGEITSFMPSFECVGCIKYTLQEQSDEINRQDQITKDTVVIYTNIQKVIDYNYILWLALSWIIKIGFLLIAVALIFYVAYYYYIYLRDVGRNL